MPYIARDPFIRKLWLLDFVFIVETSLAHVFRRGYSKIVVPKIEHLDEEWARAELERCGLEERAIDRALAA